MLSIQEKLKIEESIKGIKMLIECEELKMKQAQSQVDYNKSVILDLNSQLSKFRLQLLNALK